MTGKLQRRLQCLGLVLRHRLVVMLLVVGCCLQQCMVVFVLVQPANAGAPTNLRGYGQLSLRHPSGWKHGGTPLVPSYDWEHGRYEETKNEMMAYPRQVEGYASRGRQRGEQFGVNGPRVNMVSNMDFNMAEAVEEACGLDESGPSTPNVNCV